VLWRDFVPWAVRAGLRCPDLMCLYYERHLPDDLHELRARWGVLTAPGPPAHLALAAPRAPKQAQAAGQAADPRQAALAGQAAAAGE
jgi:ubiquinone biosynthesis protein COQ4